MDNGSESPRKRRREEKEDDELALSLSPPGKKPTTQERSFVVVASSTSVPPPPSSSEPMIPKKNCPSQETLDLTLSLSPPGRKPMTPERNSLVVASSSSAPPPPSPSEPMSHNQNPPSQETLNRTLSLFPALPQATALPRVHLSIFHTPPPFPFIYCHQIDPPIGDLPPSQRPHLAVPRPRKNPHQGPPRGKDETVEPPFRWATDRRAVVHRKEYLLAKGIRAIAGDVKCTRCERISSIEYDLETKFQEMTNFIKQRKDEMHDRAETEWLAPTFPDCLGCGHENCLKPVIAPKKRAINWLFLLLGGTLGCCTIVQLKYFCKHTGNHRTGAKDRVLYLTYMGICKQLEPGDSLFEVGH